MLQLTDNERELLAQFGFLVTADGAGITGILIEKQGKRIHAWDLLTLDRTTWEWLKPILSSVQDMVQVAAK